MGFVDFLISKLAPFECIGCGYEGVLACTDCASRHFKSIRSRCYRCRKLTDGFRTCPSCRSSSKLKSVRAGVVYEGLAKELVWCLKFEGAQAAAKEIARQMNVVADGYIVPVPTTTGRERKRGYDQAKLLARALARRHGRTYLDCLRRSGQAHQVGASRAERLRQLQGAFRVSQPRAIQGRHIILVDDVVTTGATLEAAAVAMKQAGAKTVEAVVFAQP